MPSLSAREREVLGRLQAQDREIAASLGLTRDGVRYHVRNIFAKLGVHRRADAVRRGRELGMLPRQE